MRRPEGTGTPLRVYAVKRPDALGLADLPHDLRAAVEQMYEIEVLVRQHARHEREYWLRFGEPYFYIMDCDDLKRRGGVEALRDILPRTPGYLHTCMLCWHGRHDIEAAELWLKHSGRNLKNDYEPYRTKELLDAYKNRHKTSGRGGHSGGPPIIEILNDGDGTVSIEGLGPLMRGNCQTLFEKLEPESVHLIFADPPFGTDTQFKWDRPLDWGVLWPEIWRVLRPDGVVLICSAQPHTTKLIGSQFAEYRTSWHWIRKAANSMHVDRMPLTVLEEVCVFAMHPEKITFNPEMVPLEKVIERTIPSVRRRLLGLDDNFLYDGPNRKTYREGCPINLLGPRNTEYDKPHLMPTQKPTELVRYLIRTYSHPGNKVLDFVMGSGTTGVACWLEGRKFIGIEKDAEHFALAHRRLKRLVAKRDGRDLPE